jgi:proline racemase
VTTPIRIVHCHAEGEVGDVIVAGIDPPTGDTLRDQRQFIADDGRLRAFVLNEPRGGVFRHVNLLLPPTDPDADIAFIVMEPEDTPLMSGSNAMCVATVALETGVVPMHEPLTQLTLQAPAGLVPVEATCADGKVTTVTLRNVPSFVTHRSVSVEVPGYGTHVVDTAFGGDSFVIASAQDFGFALTPDEAADIAAVGNALRAAANEQIGFEHPTLPEWDHYSFAYLTGPLQTVDTTITSTNACVINPGKLDRSPTGTGCSALLALLHERGQIALGQKYIGRSIIGSKFECHIVQTTKVGDYPAVIPTVTGRAWIYGTTEWLTDPSDPWPLGYRVSDTWPA